MYKILRTFFFACTLCAFAVTTWHVTTKPTPLDPVHLAAHLSPLPIKGKLIVGFEGTSPQDRGVQNLAAQLKTGLLGGVIFFPRNVTSPTQVKELITFLKMASPTPLWIALDQEGGIVQTLTQNKGFMALPYPKDVARTMTAEQAKALYTRLAWQLADLGFNLNFGAVLDFDNPSCPVSGRLKRCYSQNPNVIATYAAAFVDAHKEAGVTACLKHYPGHGLCVTDSHTSVADITRTHRDKERTPFRLMIERHQAPMIMVAHLIHRGMDPSKPASLSKIMIQDKLRKEDHFKGLVVSDDLHMGAILHQYTTQDAVRLALDAGCDLVIVSNNLRSQPEDLIYPLLRPIKYWLKSFF